MFAGLLNKGGRGNSVFLASVFTVLFAACYFSLRPIETTVYPNLYYNYFTSNITSRFLIASLNFVFIIIGLLFVYFISARLEIVEKLNDFPVFLYLLLTGASVDPFRLLPQVFTNIFILYSVYKLLDTYRKEQVLKSIFDAALWLCISAYFTVSSLLCFPLFFIILYILRPFYWREWVVALMGFATPVYIYECVAYLTNLNRWYLFEAFAFYFSHISFPLVSEYYLALLLSLFLLLVISVAYNLGMGFGNTVKKQKAKIILLWFMLFFTFGSFIGGVGGSGILASFAFPLSFFLGDFLFGLKQTKTINTILFFLIISALAIFLAQFGVI